MNGSNGTPRAAAADERTAPGPGATRPLGSADRVGLGRRPDALRLVPVIALAALLLLGPVGTTATQHLSSPAAPAVPTPSLSVSATATPPASEVAPPAAAGAGAGCATPGTTAAPSPADVGPASSSSTPLYNSQVEPYAVLTGPYGYVAAGAAIRDLGYGTINLTWPGAPSNSSLVAAYLTWSIIDDSLPTPNATLNGHPLNGTWSAFASPSPCWGATYIYTFIADVTPWVLNGDNAVSGIPSAYTDGASPWVASAAYPMDDQASLVAVYDNDSLSTQQVTVYTGANTEVGSGTLTASLRYNATVATWAETTYLVSDGQLPGNVAVWNGTVIDANAFPGTDPKATSTPWSEGNLSDTRTFSVSVPLGSNNTTAEVYTTSSDCLTWIGQVVSVAVPPTPPPYPVTFAEQGLNNGTAWSLTANGTTVDGTVADAASDLVVDLGNGSYSYTVPAIAGYAGPAGGSFTVDGGPVYVRLFFHQLLYTVNVTETGLPDDTQWWVQLTNATDGIDENESGLSGVTISTALGNGTFTATGGDIGLYRADPPSASFSVSGAQVNLTVTFVPPPLYDVTFQEQGLLPGTSWEGEVGTNFGYYGTDTSATSAVVALPNTSGPTDYFDAYSVPGYQAPTTIYFGVAGAPVTVLVTYSLLYTLDVNQTGLPSDVYWTAIVYGGSIYTSSTNEGETNGFAVPNGTYDFLIDSVWGYLASPASGSVTVDGANVTQAITFVAQPDYTLAFSETGLPLGTSWSVVLYLPNGSHTTGVSTGASLDFDEPNGSFYYSVGAVVGYAPTPTEGDLYVEGAPASASITFAEVYTVTFQESGLPTGSYWYVAVNDGHGGSYGSSVVVNLTNGTYPYDIVNYAGFSADPASGNVVVAGANVTVPIVFSSATEPTYTVLFSETGLPTGSNWSVSLGEVRLWATVASITFTEPNNTWSFDVYGPTGYTPTPSSGDAVVDGANVVEPVGFAAAASGFAVTFTETGLPDGTLWYVNVTGGGSYSSSSATVVLSEEDGSYAYTLGSSDLSYAAAGGGFTVDGEALGVDVTFELVTYTVTATESGLPASTTWYLNVTGGSSHSSSSDELSLALANGTYEYTLGSADLRYAGAPGGFTVSGEALGVDVAFDLVSYTVTATETGLPDGTTWYLNVTGGAPHSSATDEISFAAPNGTYQYLLASGAPGYAADGGAFTVDGEAVGVDVSFHVVMLYVVTVTESGLPSGTTWFVNVTGAASHSSSSTTMTFDVPNGTYDYVLGSADTSYAGPPLSFDVAGADTSVAVTFHLVTYALTFTETGLPSGTSWSVTLGGTTESSTTASITFHEPNGSYAYTASSANTAYTAAGGSKTVDGGVASVAVAFATSASAGQTTGFLGLPGSDGYLALGLAAAIAVILGILLAARRRKKKETGSTTNAPGGGTTGTPPSQGT